MSPIAVSLTEELEKFGAYAGLAAFFGFAVLTILYFAQSRELKRLREWAGRAPERAAELEARVAADAARRAAMPPRQPPPRPPGGQPAAAAPAPAPAGQPAPAGAGAATAAPDGGESGGGESTTPAPGGPGQPPSPAGEPAAATEEASAAGTREDEGPPAGAPAAPGPGNGAGAPPAVPVIPRATPEPSRPEPGGAPPSRRPAPALRQPPPPSRRPGQPPVRRPGTPEPPAEPPAGRGPGRTALAVGGAVLGLILAVVIGTQLLGGEEERPAPNVPTPAETTPSPDSADEPAEASSPGRGDTTVAVLNGTTVTGLAAQIADDIEEAGFLRGTTANYSDQARSASLVFYEEEFRRRAQEVARIMELPAEDIEPITEDVRTLAGDADVVVVVGADQAP